MARTSDVKEMNRRIFKEAFMSQDILTKTQLHQMTGLSMGTCSNLLAAFLEEGIIERIEDDVTHKGRPSKQYCLSKATTLPACILQKEEGYEVRYYDTRGQVIQSHIQKELPVQNGVMCLRQRSATSYSFTDGATLGYASLHPQLDHFLFIYQNNKGDVEVGMYFNGQLITGQHGKAGIVKEDDNDKAKKRLKAMIHRLVLLTDPSAVVVCSDKLEDEKLKNMKVPNEECELVIVKDYESFIWQGLYSVAKAM